MSDASQPRWHPISKLDRRVIGVLVEKAKTTPEAYPLSVNALRVGCNQKNNRDPVMDVELEDVEESLARMRAAGAVAEVQGGGRVSKFRHLLYEWLGVDKVELAVMAELLLRGAQTEGQLRGRAARMEPITDVAALRPVLASLKSKGLLVSLTSEGRGHVVSHMLFEPAELERVRHEFQSGPAATGDEDEPTPSASPFAAQRTREPESGATAPRGPSTSQALDELRHELAELRAELGRLRQDVEELRTMPR
jgi:uncharacterized protein